MKTSVDSKDGKRDRKKAPDLKRKKPHLPIEKLDEIIKKTFINKA